MRPDEIGDPPSVGDVKMQWGVKIPLRDGVRLSATLYVPERLSEPAPAIFVLTPYVGQVHHDQGVYFAARGLPFLTIDVRGRGDSEGEFKPIVHEADDAFDVIEWLAKQPYCNGKVAMWGGSYSGFVQWAAVKRSSPHLATIAPVAAPFRGADTPMRYNIFAPYTMQWLLLLFGRTSQEKVFSDHAFWQRKLEQWFVRGAPFRQLDEFLGHPSPVFQEWVSHPHRDAYWDAFNPTAQEYARLSLPVLTITGMYDGNQAGALMHYREHLRSASPAARSRHYLVIGPWDHAGTRTPKAQFCGLTVGPASLLDLGELHFQWYAWTLQGAAKPRFLQKNVAYYVMGAEQWRYADTLEEATHEVQRLYLASSSNPTDVLHSGSLTPSCADSAPDHYIYDPRDVSHAALERHIDLNDATDQRLLYAQSGQHLIYHTAPFEDDVEVTGFFSLRLWLALDQPDTDIKATLYEILEDGSAVRLATQCVRARYRDSLREARLIETREPLRYDFEHFTFVARRLRKGSRVRLVIGPQNSIYWQKNYNGGGCVSDESMSDARVVTVTLFHDVSRPSVLEVPIGRAYSHNVSCTERRA